MRNCVRRKKMYFVQRAAVLILMCLLFCVAACAEAASTQLPDELRRSVVHIYAIGYGDDGKAVTRWTGTGFAVGVAGEDSDVFLTNWHVVTCSGKFDTKHVRFWILRDDACFQPNREPTKESAVECRVLMTSGGYPDTAVIQTVEPVSGFPALALRSSRQVPDKTKVYALSFAGMKDTHYGADSGPEDVQITSGYISDHMIMTQAENTRAIIHTAAIEHGNSGGPLVTAEGVVVAQNTYGFDQSVTTEYFCAVYTDYAMKMLDALGITYTVAPGLSEIHVLVADLLRMPQIGAAQAYAVFAAGIILAVIFVLYFLKTLREAVMDMKKLVCQKQETEKSPDESDPVL